MFVQGKSPILQQDQRMTKKSYIHITLLWVALLMAFSVSAQVPCDTVIHQEEAPIGVGHGAETEAAGHDDCRDQGCCESGCFNCGMSCCTGLSYLTTSPVLPGNINGLNGQIHSLVQSNFWVGQDPFYHPPRT